METKETIPWQLRGLMFCRVKKNSKAPFENNWVNKPYTYEQISNFFPQENYGVICGYNDLAVIDCDEETIKSAVETFLPSTFSVRTGKGGVHFYYFIPDLKRKIILESEGKHLGEIQSYGSQVVGPGSIHPNGNVYEVINKREIATISLKKVKEILGKMMKLESSIPHFEGDLEGEESLKEYKEIIDKFVKVWKEGNRQNLAMSISGWLRKEKRLGINTVKAIIQRVCELTNDEEVNMRLRAVEETFKKDEDKIKGWTGLEGLGIQGLSKINNIPSIIHAYYTKMRLAEEIYKENPYFYDKNKIWWLWNWRLYRWEIVDDIDILNLVSENSEMNTVNSKEKNEIIEAMEQFGRKKIPKPIKKTWIQFKDTIVDYETGEEIKASPEYFVINPIPWTLHKERFVETPTMDRIFEEWVGKDYVKTLYEIIAYCLVPSYPIQRIFCLIGEGMNGKSCFLNLLKNFVGDYNVTATDLDLLLSSRFEKTRLYKKLVCIMGETNFSELNNTSLIKRLTGQDLMGFEYKNKNPFEDLNYAKIIIATNNLPPTTDKTTGFYRRWLILDFPNKFSEKKDILNEIPEEEYEILTVKSLMILKDLMEKRGFSGEGNIEERTKKYEDHSDPLEKFLKEYTEEDPDGTIWKFEFEKRLNQWCKENRFRTLSEVVVGKKMKEKGIDQVYKMSDWLVDGTRRKLRAWAGIKWKGEAQEAQDTQVGLT
ncbi:MAG: phage/plasmid primase, P4 family [Candidatus Pacearchaeota archaeon]